MEDDDLLIDTPWGKKRWGMLREAMALYNKQQNEKENTEIENHVYEGDKHIGSFKFNTEGV